MSFNCLYCNNLIEEKKHYILLRTHNPNHEEDIDLEEYNDMVFCNILCLTKHMDTMKKFIKFVDKEGGLDIKKHGMNYYDKKFQEFKG